MFSGTALADRSSPKLAAYYDRQMAIVAGKVYAWEGEDQPTILPIAACQVDVGRDEYYALTNNGELPVFDYVAEQPAVLIRDIARFVAGDSGVLTITSARALW